MVSANFYGNSTSNYIVGKTIMTDNQWHHVAGVYDGSSEILYIDGVEEARIASTGQIDTSAEPFWIGNEPINKNRWWGGALDDVRLYNRALSDAEMAWLAGRTKPFDKPF